MILRFPGLHKILVFFKQFSQVRLGQDRSKILVFYQHNSHTFFYTQFTFTKMSNPIVFFDSECYCYCCCCCCRCVVDVFCCRRVMRQTLWRCIVSLFSLSLFSIFPFFIISVPDYLSLSLSLSLSLFSSLSSLFSFSVLRRYGHGPH